MKKVITVALAACFSLIVLLAGCAPAVTSVIGNWNYVEFDNAVMPKISYDLSDIRRTVDSAFFFKDEDTVWVLMRSSAEKMNIVCKYVISGDKLTISYKNEVLLDGTFSFEGNRMTYIVNNGGGKIVLEYAG